MRDRISPKAKKLMSGKPYADIPDAIASYRVSDRAMDELHRMGIYVKEKPGFTDSQFFKNGSPHIPRNLQQLTWQELGELYLVAHTYYEYVSHQLGCLISRMREAEEVFKFVSAKVRLAKDGTEKVKDSKQIVDARYVHANSELLKLKCMHDLMLPIVNCADATLKTVSRNVTIALDGERHGNRASFIENHRQRVRARVSGFSRDSKYTKPVRGESRSTREERWSKKR